MFKLTPEAAYLNNPINGFSPKNHRFKPKRCYWELVYFAFISSLSFCVAAEDDFFDLSLAQLSEVRFTNIANGNDTPLDKASAVVSVITRQDIEAIGATDLNQILETVPGLHVGINNQAFFPEFNIRGIVSNFNPHTLVLIDGTPITGLVFGNKSNVWGGMPAKAIERIEIIRGPGSALYGADAFAGVINISTKKRKDIKSTAAGVRYGSFDTKSTWIEHGGRYAGFDLGVTIEYQTTDGWEEDVFTSIGSAPVRTGVDSIEFHSHLEKENLTISTSYQGRRDIEPGVGLAPIPDPSGKFNSDRVLFDTKYVFNELAPDFDLAANISYYYNTQEVASNPILFPPGSIPGFPDGVIGTPEYKEEQVRFGLSTSFDGFSNHVLRSGLGVFWGDVFETRERKNFDSFSLPALVPRPGGFAETEDTNEVFLPEEQRTNYYAFVQDEWRFSDNWSLTTRLRYDHYSDFGDTTNPRLALVWATTDSVTTKLLYGRAFRAPSFVDLFVTSNPVVLGNPELDPEVIDTYELALSHQVTKNFRYAANLFYYEIDDFIIFSGVPGEIAQNSGERTGRGFELEFDYSYNKLRFVGNYAFQKSTDGDTFRSAGEDSNQAVGETPNHQIYLRTEWRAKDNAFLSSQVNWVGKQQRSAVDDRDSIPHSTSVDLTAKYKEIVKGLNVSLTVRNVFDRNRFEPSEVGRTPGDYPLPGRNALVELEYSF